MHSLKLVNKLHLAMKALHIRRLQLMRSLHLINRPHPGLRLIPLLREKPLEVRSSLVSSDELQRIALGQFR